MATLAKSLLASSSYDESKRYRQDSSKDSRESQRLVLSSRLSNQKDNELLDLFTVDEALEKMGFGMFQLLIIMFAGLAWAVEALEVMILSILSAILKCEWELSYAEEALITTVVFIGLLLGAPMWGFVADKYGRKKVLIGANLHTFIFGLISAFAPNYFCLLLLRGLVGIGIGGAFLAGAYCLEFLPARTRAVTYCLLEFAWATGTIMEALLALFVMTHFTEHGWRWLLGLSALPLGLLLLVLLFLPESPRYLILKGKEAKAKKVLALVARVNCMQMVAGRLVTQEDKEELIKQRSHPIQGKASNSLVESTFCEHPEHRTSSSSSSSAYGTLLGEETPPLEDEVFTSSNGHSVDMSEVQRILSASSQCYADDDNECSWLCMRKIIRDKAVYYYHWFLLLFKNGWWRTTLLLWYLWFSENVVYYGGTLLTTSLFQHDNHCGLKNEGDNTTVCRTLSEQDYIDIVWTTSAEFPGTIWILVLLLIIGRKKSMAVTIFLVAVCFNLLFICSSKTMLTLILFGIRGLAAGLFLSIGLYTPEVYPTAVRGFGISLSSSFSRIGGMIAPFIAQTLLVYSFHSAIGIFIGISVLSSLAALLLPIETKGRPLKDSGR